MCRATQVRDEQGLGGWPGPWEGAAVPRRTAQTPAGAEAQVSGLHCSGLPPRSCASFLSLPFLASTPTLPKGRQLGKGLGGGRSSGLLELKRRINSYTPSGGSGRLHLPGLPSSPGRGDFWPAQTADVGATQELQGESVLVQVVRDRGAERVLFIIGGFLSGRSAAPRESNPAGELQWGGWGT